MTNNMKELNKKKEAAKKKLLKQQAVSTQLKQKFNNNLIIYNNNKIIYGTRTGKLYELTQVPLGKRTESEILKTGTEIVLKNIYTKTSMREVERLYNNEYGRCWTYGGEVYGVKPGRVDRIDEGPEAKPKVNLYDVKGYGIEGKGYESFWYTVKYDNIVSEHFLFKNLFNSTRNAFRNELNKPTESYQYYNNTNGITDNPKRNLTKYNKFYFNNMYKQYISEIITNIIRIHMNKKENIRKFSIFTSRINKYSIIVSHLNNNDSIYGIDQDNNNIINKFKYDLSSVDYTNYLFCLFYYINNIINFVDTTKFIKVRIEYKYINDTIYKQILLTNKLKIYNG